MAKPGEHMPKLGWKDQVLYWSLIVPNLAFSLGGIFISLLMQDKVAFADARVIAATVGDGNLNCFYLILWCLIAFIILLGGFQQNRIPIFGRDDVEYGPPKYDAFYPLLRRKKKLTPSQMKWRILPILLIVVSFVFSAAMFPRSFYGRAVLLEDGTVEVYDASNELVHHYTAEEITEVQLDTYSPRKYGGNWKAEMVVYTQDGERFRFAAHSFAGDELQQLHTMLDLKTHFASLITIEGAQDLHKVILSQKYDAEAQTLLIELFQPVK